MAAASALRNLITNSEEDEVIDALDAAGEGESSFAAHLLGELFTAWELCKAVRGSATPELWSGTTTAASTAVVGEANPEGEDHGEEEPAGERRRRGGKGPVNYFTLLQYLDELLQTVNVCVEGSETVTAAYSQANSLQLILTILQSCMEEVWSNLQHPMAYYHSGEEDESQATLRFHKRRETELLAAVATASSDVLCVLSPENACLAALFTSDGGLTEAQQAFLNSVVDASAVLAWLSPRPPATLLPASSDDAMEMAKDAVHWQLVLATISVQGSLLYASPIADNLIRALPFITAVLERTMPMTVWRAVLPLLMEQTPVSGEQRESAVAMAGRHLRAAQSAVKVFHRVVEVICEQNNEREEDELAFAKNPMAAYLYQGSPSSPIFTFGQMLKNVLWLTEEAAGESPDVLRRMQQALRGAAQCNAEVTTLQHLVLSSEVGVWGVANSLLMMVPITSLGDPRVIWRAMVESIRSRHALLATAAAGETSPEMDQGDDGVHNIAAHSPAAQHLIWLQLESLTQMLWTLQRKQTQHGASSGSVQNLLGAEPSDLDVLTQIAWEGRASPALRQACVGTSAHVGRSLQSMEATTVAARFSMAMMQHAVVPPSTNPFLSRGGQSADSSSLVDLGSAIVQSAAPSTTKEQQLWLSGLATVDAVVSARCEAANALIDLFLDEQYDASVYVPLQVHAALCAFLPSLRVFLKRRVQVTKDLKRNYRLDGTAVDLEHWTEVEENLGGFLDYKKEHIGC